MQYQSSKDGERKSLIFTAVLSGEEIMLEPLLKVELVVIHFLNNYGFRHNIHIGEFALIFHFYVFKIWPIIVLASK